MRPTLTPFRAMELLKSENPITVDGFRYWLDGPMMSPPEAWYPCVESTTDPRQEWFPADGLEDPITEKTTWIHYIEGEQQ